jgi:uncharacterized membrane protein YdbT with pleckstrin-like domain
MGAYVQNNLVNDEHVVHETTLHWSIYLTAAALLTLFIYPLIAMKSSEFAITNKRVIIKTGLLSRRTIEMNLSKIESVNVNQGIFGRILGYGTVRIVGTGGTKENFYRISKPLEFRKQFQQLAA